MLRCVAWASVAWVGVLCACSGANETVPSGGAAGQIATGGRPVAAGAAGAPATGGTPAGGTSTSGGAPGAGVGGARAGAGGVAVAVAGAAGTTTSNGGVASGGTAGAGGVGGGVTPGPGTGTGTAPPYKGVANAACDDLSRLSASWWYNWVLSPGNCSRGEFVPMIAGKAEKTPSSVADALAKVKTAGYRTVLGFNEPNKTDQSNLTVAQVVELWPSLTSDATIRVGSPATSADAKAWFEDFMAQAEAKSLRVDFVAVHWYGWNAGSCNDAKELEGYLTWAEKFKRPIWITEFGCMNASNPSADVVKNFYSSALAMLENHKTVERYAWYPWNTNNELVLTGNLTALGTAFGQAPSVR